MTPPTDTRTYAAFGCAVLIGGANFVAVSVSNQELPPLFGATLRFAAAGVLFFLLLQLRRVPIARGRAAAGAALYGLLGFGVAYACAYYSLVGLSAGATSVIFAAVPLFTLLLAAGIGQERLTARGIGGGLLAIAGISVLSWGTFESGLELSYVLAAVVGAVAVAGSSLVAKSLPRVHPLNMNAIGMAAGTAFLAGGSQLLGEAWFLPRESATWTAVGWLVLIGSVGLFQLFLYVIGRWTASATVYALAAMPVVAVALGALLLDQPATGWMLVGGMMVLTAVYIGAIARRRPAPVMSEPRRGEPPGVGAG